MRTTIQFLSDSDENVPAFETHLTERMLVGSLVKLKEEPYGSLELVVLNILRRRSCG